LKHGLRVLLFITLSAFAAGQGEVRYGPLQVAASIGEAIVWELSAEYRNGEAPELGHHELDLDSSWVLIDGPLQVREHGDTRSVTRWKWTVLSLEAGERRLPSLSLLGADGNPFEVVSEALKVSPELAPAEDAPRPLAGFQGVRDERATVRPVHIIGLTALVVALFSTLTYLRKRRAPAPEPPPNARARIRELRALDMGESSVTRAMYFELSSLVRFAVERHLENRPQELLGLTDEEWLEFVHVHGQLEEALYAQLALFFSACARVKYGLQTPTKFLRDETLTTAETIVEAVAAEEAVA